MRSPAFLPSPAQARAPRGKPSPPGATPSPGAATRPPPSTRCWRPSTSTSKASATPPARPNRSNGSGASTATPGASLPRAEYFRLVTAARDAGDHRTRLLLETLCSTGIRVSELQFITAEAVRRRKASIRCKGKCREILLPAKLCHRLARWCQRRRIHAGPVFLSRSGGALSRVTVWKLLKSLCARANVAWGKVFPHNLRHLFARTFYGIEKNISKLADLLGHSSIETTRIYIMESGAEHERLLNQMHLLL